MKIASWVLRVSGGSDDETNEAIVAKLEELYRKAIEQITADMSSASGVPLYCTLQP